MAKTLWTDTDDPKLMLRALPRKFSRRKLRLFACACCHRVREHFEGDDFWELVLLCEQFADGQANRQEVKRLTHDIQMAGFHNSRAFDACLYTAGECNFWGSQRVDRYDAWDAERAADACARHAAGHSNPYRDEERPPEYVAEAAAQCHIFRDLFGDLSPLAAFPPAWRTPTVLALASKFYEERTFDHVPVLGDALEDAGCNSAKVLQHCRAPATHYRGCWVVDLMLHKS